jgi:heterodisulfide reductase subunit A
MRTAERIGFYICHCGINIAAKVRCAEVAEEIARMQDVVVSRDYLFMCSDPGQELIEKDIAEHGLTRVVVASCSPRMHENTFRGACARAGLNPYRSLHHVCVREHVSWVHEDEDEATEKAKQLARAGVLRVRWQESLFPQTFPVNTSTLVVGGGIAGMQAALDVAKAGFKAYLVEKTATVGGHMLQYDKTFPTLDCAACIGTPKMVSVGQNPNIELLSLSEVEDVSGFVGNFRVRVRRKARYVDEDRCTGCGECAKACPVTVPNEWDVGTLRRHAVYRPFPQAVPIAYAIDKRDRGPCVQTCPAGTNVQGYVALIREGKYEEALRLIMERLPLPGTLGRVCPAPCEAECRRREIDAPVAIRNLKRFAADRVDWETLPTPLVKVRPEKVAVVGAGPAGLSAAYFLALAGYPVTVFEALPYAGGMLRAGIPDYRLPPEVLDREIAYIRRVGPGVDLRLGVTVGRDVTIDGLFEEGYRAVFAAPGAHRDAKLRVPGEDAEGVLPGVAFLREENLHHAGRVGRRAIVIGGGAVAMDVARVALRKGAESVRVFCLEQRGEMPAFPEEVEAALSEGIEIVNGWGPKRFLGENGRAAGVEFMRCTSVFDEAGRFRPRYDESETTREEADTVLVAIGQGADPTWREGADGVETTRRGTVVADPRTFATERPGLFVGGEAFTGPSLVVEAVAAGREAALSIDRYLRGVDLLEDRPARPTGRNWAPVPGDATPEPRREPAHLEPEERKRDFREVEQAFTEDQARAEAARCISCGVCSECMACVSRCDAKAIRHDQRDEIREIEVGSIIVATGFDVLDPTPMREYGYGRLPNVFTNLEFERLSNATGPTGGKILLRRATDRFAFEGEPESVAILHCVGSRDRNYHEYCSRTCCMYALKYAHLVKDKVGPETQVFNFYIDMRCFGDGYEEFLTRIQGEGVRMVRGKATLVTDEAESPEEEGKLVVVAEDTLTSTLLRVPVDMVVLCTAMEPREDADEVARIFGLSTKASGFFLEEHPKLEPVSTPTSGVFLAGACQSPKDIPDTVAQAKGAASEAIALSARGSVEVSPVISHIDPDICVGCRVCVELCPYSAIEFDERHGISVVNEAVCKGCGSCAAYCPSGAAGIRNFTKRQVFAEIDGLLQTTGVA